MDYGLTQSKRKARICMLLNLICSCECATLAGRRDCLTSVEGALESRQKRMTSLKPRYPARNMLTRVRTYLHRAQLPSEDDINSFINNADFETFVNLARPSDRRFHFPIYFPLLTASTRMKRVI